MTSKSEFLGALLSNPHYTSFAAWSFYLSAVVFLVALVVVSRKKEVFEATARLPLSGESADLKSGGVET